MEVVLYRVGRNLNRAYRACSAGGISCMTTVECVGSVSGSLYSASDTVDLAEGAAVKHGAGTAYLEVDGDVPLEWVDWSGVQRLVIGGESTTLPRRWRGYGRIRIPQHGGLCHTVEAALSIALYARASHRPLSAPPRWRYAGYGLYACGLPRRCDVQWMSESAGVRSLIDLTQRERATVRRACADAGIAYIKHPTAWDADPAPIGSVLTPAVVHCYHGRDRTSRFVARWRAENGSRC